MLNINYLILSVILMALCSCSTDPNLNIKILSNPSANNGIKYSVMIVNPDNKKNYINSSISSITQTVLENNVKVYTIDPNKDKSYKISIENDNQAIGLYFILNKQPNEGWKFYFEKPHATDAEFIVSENKVSKV